MCVMPQHPIHLDWTTLLSYHVTHPEYQRKVAVCAYDVDVSSRGPNSIMIIPKLQPDATFGYENLINTTGYEGVLSTWGAMIDANLSLSPKFARSAMVARIGKFTVVIADQSHGAAGIDEALLTVERNRNPGPLSTPLMKYFDRVLQDPLNRVIIACWDGSEGIGTFAYWSDDWFLAHNQFWSPTEDSHGPDEAPWSVTNPKRQHRLMWADEAVEGNFPDLPMPEGKERQWWLPKSASIRQVAGPGRNGNFVADFMVKQMGPRPAVLLPQMQQYMHRSHNID